jgi:hypothetical protein
VYNKDATASGPQSISMLLGNGELMKKTNVIGAPSRDLYQQCLEAIKLNMTEIKDDTRKLCIDIFNIPYDVLIAGEDKKLSLILELMLDPTDELDKLYIQNKQIWVNV